MKPKAAGTIDTPWLTSDEAAAYLKFPSVSAFNRWLEFNDLPCGRRGRVRLWDRAVLDAFVRREIWTQRRSKPGPVAV